MVTTRRRAAASSMPAALSALLGLGPPQPSSAFSPDASLTPSSAHSQPQSEPRARRASFGGAATPEVVDITVVGDEDEVVGGGCIGDIVAGLRGQLSPASRSGMSVKAKMSTNVPATTPSPAPSLALPHLALFCVAVSVLALMLSLALHLGIVAGGLVGPAWSTFKAIERRPGSAPVTRWASFWVVAALLFGLDRLLLAAVLKPWLPGPMYSLMLFLSVVWLSRDDAVNTERLYGAVARPLFLRYEDSVDAALAGIADRVDDMSRFGLIQVSHAVKPIAMQLDHAAAVAQEQHDRIAQRRRHKTVAY
jgi:TB2/DP1, HVA22 family